jgi:hypothetical protein
MAAAGNDAWFETAPANQRPALDALRELILTASPGTVEELKWSRPVYSNAGGMFCYLHRTKNHVTLGFHRGASLDDPKNLLEGTGKDMRHVKISAVENIDAPALRRLLKQAAKTE